jgi:hypothetical protein
MHLSMVTTKLVVLPRERGPSRPCREWVTQRGHDTLASAISMKLRPLTYCRRYIRDRWCGLRSPGGRAAGQHERHRDTDNYPIPRITASLHSAQRRRAGRSCRTLSPLHLSESCGLAITSPGDESAWKKRSEEHSHPGVGFLAIRGILALK